MARRRRAKGEKWRAPQARAGKNRVSLCFYCTQCFITFFFVTIIVPANANENKWNLEKINYFFNVIIGDFARMKINGRGFFQLIFFQLTIIAGILEAHENQVFLRGNWVTARKSGDFAGSTFFLISTTINYCPPAGGGKPLFFHSNNN